MNSLACRLCSASFLTLFGLREHQRQQHKPTVSPTSTQTPIRTLPLHGEVWIAANDVSNFMIVQRRAAFEAGDTRGQKVLAWLTDVFQQVASSTYETKEITSTSLDHLPTTQELEHDLIVLRTELEEEDHG